MRLSLEPEAILIRLRRLAIGLTAALSGLGLFWGVSFGLAVAAGGALALANYGFLVWTIDRLMSRWRSGASWLGAVGFALRYALLGLALYVIFRSWRPSAIAIIAGFSAPVMAIFLECGLEVYQALFAGEARTKERSEPRSESEQP